MAKAPKNRRRTALDAASDSAYGSAPDKAQRRRGGRYAMRNDAALTSQANLTGIEASVALTLSNGKTKVYYQSTQPTSANEGDLWFDTTIIDGTGMSYRPKQYLSGVWTLVPAAALIVAADIAAGAIIADKIASNAISSSDYNEDANGAATAGARLRNIYSASTAWATNTTVSAGAVKSNGGKVYKARTGGTTINPTTPAAWVYTTTYSIGQRVTFGANEYKSLQNGNVNNQPYEGDGKSADSAWWANEGSASGPGYYTGAGVRDGTVTWDQVVPLSVSPDGIQIGVATLNEGLLTTQVVYAGSFVYNNLGDFRFDYSAFSGPLRISRVNATNTILIEWPAPAGRSGSIGSVFMSERYNANGSSPKGWTFVRGLGTDPAPTQPTGWGYTFGQLINSSAVVQTPTTGYRCSFLVSLL